MDGDKFNLIGNTEAAHTHKANQGINSLLPMGKWVFSTSRRAGPMELYLHPPEVNHRGVLRPR